MRNKMTTITGFTANPENAPTDLDARMVWIDAHLKSTYRAGHWNGASCKKIADKMGIAHNLEIKHH